MNKCANPPQLDDSALLLYLDGDATEEIGAHLETCSYCRSRMLKLNKFQNGLRTRFNRIDCPPSLTLGEYHRDLLDFETHRQITKHLSGCTKCKTELAQLTGFMEAVKDPGQEPDLLHRVQLQIARFIGGSQPGEMATAPVGIRGNLERVWVFEAGDLQITLRGVVHGSPEGDYQVVGLITGKEVSGWVTHLMRKGEIIASRKVENLGNFKFGGVRSGIYDLILERGNQEIHIQAVEIQS